MLRIEWEFSNNLSFSMLNLLQKVSTLPSLVTISLVKIEIKNFQFVIWPYFDNVIKGPWGFKSGSLLQ